MVPSSYPQTTRAFPAPAQVEAFDPLATQSRDRVSHHGLATDGDQRLTTSDRTENKNIEQTADPTVGSASV